MGLVPQVPRLDKKALFDTLLEGDIEVGLDGEGEQKWQIVRMPLVFKAQALRWGDLWHCPSCETYSKRHHKPVEA